MKCQNRQFISLLKFPGLQYDLSKLINDNFTPEYFFFQLGKTVTKSLEKQLKYLREQVWSQVVSRYSVIFFAFCANKEWRLLAQVSRTSDHDDSLVSRAKILAAQDQSNKCRFPQSCLPRWSPLFFPTRNGWKQITDYRGTADWSFGDGLCRTLHVTSLAHLTVFSFEFLYPVFTDVSSVFILYHIARR